MVDSYIKNQTRLILDSLLALYSIMPVQACDELLEKTPLMHAVEARDVARVE
jgi:hypothetical protein